MQQNPGLGDVIRQRLQQSGLTAEQIRARLQASGYPTGLLDIYLNGPAVGAVLPAGALELSALQALGLPPIEQNLLPVDTGLIRMRGGYGTSRVFGVDVFRRTTTQFLPLLAGPVPPDYRLGPGDVLVLILTGDVELAYTLPITREGFILITQVGQVYVSHLTLDQLRDVLYTRLSRVYSGVRRSPNATTRFDVSVANVRANQVYVVGEVAQPGAYQISSLGTVLTALYVAGGLTERADMRAVEVRRLGKPVAALDLYDYLLRGDTHSDLRLETGDVVFVPVHGIRAEVGGAVVRPAIYELKESETLLDLLRAAGGFKPNAQLKRLAIHRLLPAARRAPGSPPRAALDVSLSPSPSTPIGSGEKGEGLSGDPLNGVSMPRVSLEDGDSVVVDTVSGLAGQYYVAIAGMVQKPGIYPWQQGMTLRDLVLLARGPTVGADLREAELGRMPEDRTKGQLATTIRVPLDSTYLFERDSLGHYFGPPGLPFPSKGAPDVGLQPYDNVLLLKQPEFDFQRTVVIAGEVRSPGTYSLRTKTDRLAELVKRAGGLTSRAYPEGIRFVRPANNVGRINVDLPRAVRDTNSSANVVLQPGDSIEIPEFQPAVKVSGAVTSPGSVLWKQGAELDYYLDGVGGVTYQGDKGRVSVKYANGDVRTRRKTVFFSSTPRPGPGSEVFVPVRDTTARVNVVQLFTSIVQIVASTVTAIYVIKHL
jgi:protein involved in polysaccharide export with SLBB domain